MFPSGILQSQFQVLYDQEGFRFPFSLFASGTATEFTITRLAFEREYNITIRPLVRFLQCPFNTILGTSSPVVTVFTQETGIVNITSYYSIIYKYDLFCYSNPFVLNEINIL